MNVTSFDPMASNGIGVLVQVEVTGQKAITVDRILNLHQVFGSDWMELLV